MSLKISNSVLSDLSCKKSGFSVAFYFAFVQNAKRPLPAPLWWKLSQARHRSSQMKNVPALAGMRQISMPATFTPFVCGQVLTQRLSIARVESSWQLSSAAHPFHVRAAATYLDEWTIGTPVSLTCWPAQTNTTPFNTRGKFPSSSLPQVLSASWEFFFFSSKCAVRKRCCGEKRPRALIDLQPGEIISTHTNIEQKSSQSGYK